MAAELGQPFMPWQALVADVGLELLPNGLPAYREVIVTGPRQQGKTTLELAVECHRCLLWRRQPQRVAYSAQTGSDGRSKLIDDQVPIIEASAVTRLVRRVYRAVGAEGVVFRTGSRIDVVASRQASGHGKVTDLGIVDEAFADVDDRREQALVPAMVTRRDAQLWVLSTQGTEESAYFNRKVDLGRAAVADGVDRGVAFFEWSAPDHAPIDDPATWAACMPALGRTIAPEVVLHNLRTMTELEFRRAFLNQRTKASARLISAAAWSAVSDEGVAPAGEVVFGIDVAVDRASAAIVAADGAGRCEVIEHREGEGVGWLVDRVAELAGRWHGLVAVDERGPAASELPELEARGVPLERYGAATMAQACARLFDAIADGEIRVRPHEALDQAVDGARRRVAGDAWYWARKDASVDLSPLVALTVAYDAAVSSGRNSQPWATWG